jgi:murein DD-endopeptidase MepM/ murein hydrolase activator NlpD
MKKIFIIVILIILAAVFWLYRFVPLIRKNIKTPTVILPSLTISPQLKFALPIQNYFQNQTKKIFGQYITFQNSPVQPERFTGYHTGVDIEVNEEDLNSKVDVLAIADSKLIYKNWVSGYGEVVVIAFSDNGQDYTALYGHLNIDSVLKNIGDSLEKGEKIGELGQAFSTQTDGERKHLHFSIHKGSAIELRGYVQNKSLLNGWVDPNQILSENN